MVIDVNLTYCGDHLYIYIKSLSHIPYINKLYISIYLDKKKDFNILRKREYVKVLTIAQTYIKYSTYRGSCDYNYNY